MGASRDVSGTAASGWGKMAQVGEGMEVEAKV